jgi:hypothetical protein
MITFTIQALKDRWARVRANPKFQKLEEVAVRVFGFIILRLQEASTWRGITLALSAVGGYSFGDTPDKALAFVGIGMFLAGLVGMVFPDAVKKAEQVDHSQSSFGYGSFGHGEGNQIVDNPDHGEGDVTPVSKRAPR